MYNVYTAVSRKVFGNLRSCKSSAFVSKRQSFYVSQLLGSRADPAGTDLGGSKNPNPSTGAVISHFPTTSAEIGRMTKRDIDSVLQELGLRIGPTATSLAMKKRQLRIYIGLRVVVPILCRKSEAV